MTPEIVAKIEVGDGLTDEELAIALAFYTETTRNLEVLGPAFRLACNETRRRLYELKGYFEHRGLSVDDDILKGLGVDADLLKGPTHYSTSRIALDALEGKHDQNRAYAPKIAFEETNLSRESEVWADRNALLPSERPWKRP